MVLTGSCPWPGPWFRSYGAHLHCRPVRIQIPTANAVPSALLLGFALLESNATERCDRAARRREAGLGLRWPHLAISSASQTELRRCAGAPKMLAISIRRRSAHAGLAGGPGISSAAITPGRRSRSRRCCWRVWSRWAATSPFHVSTARDSRWNSIMCRTAMLWSRVLRHSRAARALAERRSQGCCWCRFWHSTRTATGWVMAAAFMTAPWRC